jgi:predicted transcriptional regulator
VSAGESLAKLRRDFNINRAEIANKAEMSVRYITWVENGRITPTPLWVASYTAALIAIHQEKNPGKAASTAPGSDQNIND